MVGKEIDFEYIDKNGKERSYCGTYSKVHQPDFKTLEEFIEHLKKKFNIISEIRIYDTEFVFL